MYIHAYVHTHTHIHICAYINITPIIFFLFFIISTKMQTFANQQKEGRKCFILRHTQHILFTVIWRQTWLRTILIERKETQSRHMGYSFRLTARVLLHAPSHRQDSTYHGLCYTSCGALAGMRNRTYGKGPFR